MGPKHGKTPRKKHLSILSPSVHDDSKKFEDGRCLSKHDARKIKNSKHNYKSSNYYTVNCSCSYRWQGKHSENNNPNIYNKDRHELIDIIKNGSSRTDLETAPEDVKKRAAAIKVVLSKLKIEESGIKVGKKSNKTKSGMYPENYGQKISLPRHEKKGDWYVRGPDEPVYKIFKNGSKSKIEVIPKGQNFTKWIWPYWHNHHHLIPAGMFNVTIREVAEEKNISYRIFCNWLAGSPLNIHYMDNILILPLDISISYLLGLPRHLKFQKCHPQYDKFAKKLIRPILKRAANALKKGKKHSSAIKSQRNVADKLYKKARDLGGKLIELGSMSKGPVAADELLK